MALNVVPDRDDADDEQLDSPEAVPTMGQLIRETSLLLPGLKPGRKTIDNIEVRVTEQPHARELHSIGGPAHHVKTRVVTAQFQRKGRTPTFTLLGEYGEEMQPIVWSVTYTLRPGVPASALFDTHQSTPPSSGIEVLHVQRLQKLMREYRGKDQD